MRKVQSQFGVGSLQQKLAVGDLHFLADAEVARGGSGTGPSPHEYLAAALASCTSMTLKM
jgi:putative redox protein